MIPVKLQIILLISSIFGLYLLVNMISKYRLELKYALLWLLMGVTAIIMALFPDLSQFVANTLGIETPVNALFLIAISALLVILFSLTTALSRISCKLKDAVQEIGLLKQELEDLKSKTG